MVRLFVCIWLSKELKDKLISFQNKIKKLPIKGKFVRNQNMHITLVFVGEVEDDKIDVLKNKIKNITEKKNKFKLKIKGLELLPSQNYIRIIGVKIKTNKELINLIKEIGNRTNSKFHDSAKITLCRVKNVFNKHVVKKFIEKNKDIEIGDLEVKKISLVKSTLSRKGPVYQTLEEFKLT